MDSGVDIAPDDLQPEAKPCPCGKTQNTLFRDALSRDYQES